MVTPPPLSEEQVKTVGEGEEEKGHGEIDPPHGNQGHGRGGDDVQHRQEGQEETGQPETEHAPLMHLPEHENTEAKKRKPRKGLPGEQPGRVSPNKTVQAIGKQKESQVQEQQARDI